VLIAVPRVRDILEGKEVSLSSDRGFQNPRSIDEVVLKRLINGELTFNVRKIKLNTCNFKTLVGDDREGMRKTLNKLKNKSLNVGVLKSSSLSSVGHLA
jgi:hypothetical protein